jgi:flagellar protein FliS
MMKSGDFAGKGRAISKAISIINEGLRASLDRKAGKDIADNLDALYEYMSRRLFEAHLNNDAQILQEIQGLMQDLKGAWDEIGSKTADVLPIERKTPAPAYDPLEPRLSRLVRA